MKTDQELKELVREKYAEIALNEKEVNQASCCGATNVSEEVYNIMSDDYSDLDGYAKDADLGLGCGLPTEFAAMRPGDTVIDLGSGAGNDCFVAREAVGAEGKVIGVDFTEAMIERARMNAETLGFNNVEFRQGDIEDMPVSKEVADVVVSNCVLNLVPNKQGVLQEVFRVLKPGGHFSISDIVLEGTLPDGLREDAEMYAGCVSGAIQQSEYLEFIREAGFKNLQIQKSKAIVLPEDILEKHLDKEGLEAFRASTVGIHSITVYAEKPGGNHLNQPLIEVKSSTKEEVACCTPGTGCC